MNTEISKNLEAIEERKLGKYVLPFRVNLEDTEERESNVVYISSRDPRTTAIIEELEDGSYQDWYFNDGEGRFKPLTWNNGDEYEDLSFRESWLLEEIPDRLPEPFRNYIPKPRY